MDLFCTFVGLKALSVCVRIGTGKDNCKHLMYVMHNLELSEQEIIRRQSLDELRSLGVEP